MYSPKATRLAFKRQYLGQPTVFGTKDQRNSPMATVLHVPELSMNLETLRPHQTMAIGM